MHDGWLGVFKQPQGSAPVGDSSAECRYVVEDRVFGGERELGGDGHGGDLAVGFVVLRPQPVT